MQQNTACSAPGACSFLITRYINITRPCPVAGKQDRPTADGQVQSSPGAGEAETLGLTNVRPGTWFQTVRRSSWVWPQSGLGLRIFAVSQEHLHTTGAGMVGGPCGSLACVSGLGCGWFSGSQGLRAESPASSASRFHQRSLAFVACTKPVISNEHNVNAPGPSSLR